MKIFKYALWLFFVFNVGLAQSKESIKEDMTGCPTNQSSSRDVLLFFMKSQADLGDLSYITWKCAVKQLKNGKFTQIDNSIYGLGGFPASEGKAYIGDSLEIKEISRTAQRAYFKVIYTPFAFSQKVKDSSVLKYTKYSGPEISIDYTLVLIDGSWFVLSPPDVFLFKKQTALNMTNLWLSNVKNDNSTTIEVLKSNKKLFEEK